MPRPGETVTGARLERMPGGKGANQAVAAARLGARTRFVGRIGTDDLALRSLEREGVDASGVVRDEGESGVALIVVDASGENTIVVAPGALLTWTTAYGPLVFQIASARAPAVRSSP